MTTNRETNLIGLLGHAEQKVRDTVLDLLSDELVQDAAILPEVFSGWDRFGIAEAFPGFPQVINLSIPAGLIEECCQRAREYAERRALTDPVCRIAGKLMEQVVGLPARDLAQWFPLIEKTVRVSKIFFRVDLKLLRRRIELADTDSDELMRRLEALIPTEVEDSAKLDKKLAEAFWLLQAVRTYHPHSFDPRLWLSQDFEATGEKIFKHKSVSSSLANVAAPGLERELVFYVVDDRESVHAVAIEALVRIGSPLAAELLLAAFPCVCQQAQHWIARALQRIHVPGLAPRIAEVRNVTADTRLGNALLIAEILQFDLDYADDLARMLSECVTDSDRLIDCLQIYHLIHADHAQGDPTPFQLQYTRFLKSCIDLGEIRRVKMLRQRRHLRSKLSKEVVERYRLRGRDSDA